VRITILASGSSGNATLLESGGTRILVDAGIGVRTLARKLHDTGTDGLPHAIVVTHAHHDHVGYCARLSRKLRIPVHATEATARAAQLGGNVRLVDNRRRFRVGGMTVLPLPVPHDAAQVALVFDDGTHRVGIATDVGEVTSALFHHVAGCDALLLESNHDSELLERGPYPATLKRRIASARGHLSNAQACELLRALGPRARHVVLMHLSETNNRPQLALEAARDVLRGRDVRLSAAHQKDPLVVELESLPRGAQLALPGVC
jgi:phosphoribosyl 1,2-cyclic phosphodiesterase